MTTVALTTEAVKAEIEISNEKSRCHAAIVLIRIDASNSIKRMATVN